MSFSADREWRSASPRSPYREPADSSTFTESACDEAASLIDHPDSHELGRLMDNPKFRAFIQSVREQCSQKEDSPSTMGYGELPKGK